MIFEEWASYHVHLNYLRALLRSNGGIDSLGWQGWFAYAYTWAELRWATQMARRARLMSTEACLGNDLRPELQPLHVSTPFPSTVLPIGFREMVDSGLLNATIVALLEKVTGWGLALAGDFARMIPSCSLSQVEKLLCTAVVAYIVSFIEGPEGHSRGLEDLTADLDLFNCLTFDIPFCLWAATVIAAANPTMPAPLPHRWTLIDRMMAIEGADKTWPEAVLTYEKFFWVHRHESHWKQCWDTATERNAADRK
ncbi:hypothetical protein LTR10_023429 [Elasticomyces elasticus]|nr:hypothetical protein LTR10_023429 [Elasticomyces elasticus]